jgi:hypothetical protein
MITRNMGANMCKYHPQSESYTICNECKVSICKLCVDQKVFTSMGAGYSSTWVHECKICSYIQTKINTIGTCIFLIIFISEALFFMCLTAKTIDLLFTPEALFIFIIFFVIPISFSLLRLKLNKKKYLKWINSISLSNLNWDDELKSKPNPVKVWIMIGNIFYFILIVLPFIWFFNLEDLFYLYWGLILLGSYIFLYFPFQLKIYKKYKDSHW